MANYIKPNQNIQGKRVNKLEHKTINFKIDSKFKLPIYSKLKVFVRTYGCQANIIDSELITYILKTLGFKIANDINKADLVILNTCAIRQNAENKVYGEIGLLAKNRKKNKNFKLVVCGCMAQQEKTYGKLIKNINVDLVFGTHNINQLPLLLNEVYKHNAHVYSVKHNKDCLFNFLPRCLSARHKAFVSIMDGCNNFCTYCIVPYTRGQQISRPKEDIINEIKTLIKQGCKEITLIGQNVNAYGIDFKDKKYVFKNLLEDVAKLDIKRVRFSTSNPWNFDCGIIDVVTKYPNIMPSIHLPIQSGDNGILKAMNRKMDIKDYVELVQHMKHQIKDLAITTDLIVAFPNETKKAFENTLKLYKTIQFDNAYTFIFSPREGTPAAKLENKLSEKEKNERLQKLNELVKK